MSERIKLRAILVDDERSSIESLTYELGAYCPEVEVIATCRSGREALVQIPDLKPDLVFLDIEMPNMTGFEMLQEFGEISFSIIFVTAYDAFALKAFEFNAVDYLLKPIRKAKIQQAVQKVIDRNDRTFSSEKLKALVNNIQLQSSSGIQRIALPAGEGFDFVPVDDIAFLNAESNYTWVHLIAGKKYLVSKTLKDVSSMVTHRQFFRAHKSFVVNLNSVTRYIRGQGGHLVLETGDKIPVSRGQKEALMKLLQM